MTGAMVSFRFAGCALRTGHCRILLLSMTACFLLAACGPEAASPAQADTTDAQSQVRSRPEAASRPAPSAAGARANAQVPVKGPHPDMLTLADEVAALGDAQALALAAMLRDGAMMGAGPESTVGPKTPPTRMDGKVREWIDEAQRRAPDEVTVLVLAVYLERYDEARRQALVARWRALEPQNLAPVFHATLSEAALFETAATTSVYDSHYDDVLRLIIDTLSRASSPALARMGVAQPGMTREEQAAAMALVFWATSGIPAFQRLSTPCRAEALSAMRQQECRRIAGVLLHRSDVLIAEGIGAGIFLRGPGTAAEKAEANVYKREGDWLGTCTNLAYQRDPRGLARRFAQLIRGGQHVTERAVMRQLAIESGFPPSPPAGWQRGTP
jgi:hypothetical protein